MHLITFGRKVRNMTKAGDSEVTNASLATRSAWETLGKDAKGVDIGKYVRDVYKMDVPSSTISIAKKKVFPDLFEEHATTAGRNGKTLFDVEGDAGSSERKPRRTRAARPMAHAAANGGTVAEIDVLLHKLTGGDLGLAAKILGVAAAFGSVGEMKLAVEKMDAAVAAAGGPEEFEKVLAALNLKG
jgi:hypothetical protein